MRKTVRLNLKRDALREILRVEGMDEAAKLTCHWCARVDLYGLPYVNSSGMIVHRTVSSRGLASEHHCSSAEIHIQRDVRLRKVIEESR